MKESVNNLQLQVRENERLLEEGRDVPSLKLALGRSLSIGRRGSRDLGPRRHSKWQDALSEVGDARKQVAPQGWVLSNMESQR